MVDIILLVLLILWTIAGTIGWFFYIDTGYGFDSGYIKASYKQRVMMSIICGPIVAIIYGIYLVYQELGD